jgi:uncharacterized membrane protein YciS (DUF1049 family)
VSIVNHLSDEAVRRIDVVSFGTIIASLFGWLPHIAALASLVWIGLRIRNELLEHKIKKQEHLINERKLAE